MLFVTERLYIYDNESVMKKSHMIHSAELQKCKVIVVQLLYITQHDLARADMHSIPEPVDVFINKNAILSQYVYYYLLLGCDFDSVEFYLYI